MAEYDSTIESCSELLDATMQQAKELNRRWEEARGVMEVPKRENGDPSTH